MYILDIYSVDNNWEEYYDFITTSIENAYFSWLKKGAILDPTSVFPKRTIIHIEKR